MKNYLIGCALIVLAAAILNYEPFAEAFLARLGAAAVLIIAFLFLLREKHSA